MTTNVSVHSHIWVLDTGSNINLTNNLHNLADVQLNKTHVNISTINGSEKTNLIGNIGCLTNVFVVPNSPINVLSFSYINEMNLFDICFEVNKFTIKYKNQINDSHKDQVLIFHLKNGLYICDGSKLISFFESYKTNGLSSSCYTNDLINHQSNETSSHGNDNVVEAKSTIQKQLYTTGEIHEIKVSKRDFNIVQKLFLMHIAMGHIGKSLFHKTMKSDSILNTDNSDTFFETISKRFDYYYNLMTKIYGECIICRQINSYLSPAKSDTFYSKKVGEKTSNDIVFFTAKYKYLLHCDEYSQFIVGIYLNNSKKENLITAFGTISDQYKLYDNNLQRVYVDHDSTISTIGNDLAKLKINLIVASPNNHSSLIESKVRLIRNRVLDIIHSTPYIIPEIFVPYMINYIIGNINITCTVKHDQSPRILFMGKDKGMIKSNLLNYFFGQILLAKRVNRNSKLEVKADLVIILGKDLFSMGTYVCFNIETQSIIYRRELLSINISSSVLEYVRTQLHNLQPFTYNYNKTISTINSLYQYDNMKTDIHIKSINDFNLFNKNVNPSAFSNKNGTHDEEDDNNLLVVRPIITNNNNTLVHREMNIESDQPDVNNSNPDVTDDVEYMEEPIPDLFNINEQNQIQNDVNNEFFNCKLLFKRKIPNSNKFKYMVSFDNYDHTYDMELFPSDIQGYSPADFRKVPLYSQYKKSLAIVNNESVDDMLNDSNVDQNNHIVNDNIPNEIDDENESVQRTNCNYVCLTGYYGCFTNISLNASLKHDQNATLQATIEELDKIYKMETLHILHYSELNDNILSKTVLTFPFYKSKTSADGKFLRYKCRIVANGAKQSAATYDPDMTFCPTVRFSSFLLIVNIGVYLDYEWSCMDVGNAFLHSKIDGEIYIKLDTYTSKILTTNIAPQFKNHMNAKGHLYCKLLKGLYGLVQSPALWIKCLTNALVQFGFVRSKGDDCVFNKGNIDSSTHMMLVIHIDDIFIMSKKKVDIDEFKKFMIKKFTNITFNQNEDRIDYLNIQLFRNRKDKSVILNQTGFLNDVIESLNVLKSSELPLYKNKFQKEGTKLDYNQDFPNYSDYMKLFLKKLMKCQYLTYTRPDLITSISYLSTRTHCLCQTDFHMLDDLLSYINNTKHLYLKLKPSELKLMIYCDASYSCHKDLYGHTGLYVTFGGIHNQNYNGFIMAKSSKQRLIVKSSFEAELLAFNSATDEALYLKNLISSIGIQHNWPVEIYNDNLPTITAIKSGKGSHSKSKHINVKFFFIKQYIDSNDISIRHISSIENIADFFTKPLFSELFFKFRNLMLNHEEKM